MGKTLSQCQDEAIKAGVADNRQEAIVFVNDCMEASGTGFSFQRGNYPTNKLQTAGSVLLLVGVFGGVSYTVTKDVFASVIFAAMGAVFGWVVDGQIQKPKV